MGFRKSLVQIRPPRLGTLSARRIDVRRAVPHLAATFCDWFLGAPTEFNHPVEIDWSPRSSDTKHYKSPRHSRDRRLLPKNGNFTLGQAQKRRVGVSERSAR